MLLKIIPTKENKQVKIMQTHDLNKVPLYSTWMCSYFFQLNGSVVASVLPGGDRDVQYLSV